MEIDSNNGELDNDKQSGKISDHVENILSDDDSPLLSDKEGELETVPTQPIVVAAPVATDEILDFEEGEDNSDLEPADASVEPSVSPPSVSGKVKPDDDEEGEVNSEDDLEEGEVKEDEDDADTKLDPGNQQQHKQKSVCRFFGAGKCTWGDSCRFYHEIPESKRNQQSGGPGGKAPLLNHPPQAARNFNFPPGRQQGPLLRHPPPPQRHSMPPHDFYPPPHAAPLLPLPHPQALLPLPNTAESSWERGVRSVKKIVADASKRKEQELDFEEKRMNQGIEPEGPLPPPRDLHYHGRHGLRHSRSPSPRPRGRSPSPYYREREFREHREPPLLPPPRPGMDRMGERHHHREMGRNMEWDSEYERRHRLAFESAPWNDNGPPPPPAHGRSPPHHRHERSSGGGNGGGRGNPEQFRDPWRRSKSPGNRRNDRQPHSGIRATGSDTGSDLSGSSDMSGSDSSDSFGKSDAKNKKNKPEPKPRVDRRPPPKDILPRGNQPDVSRLPRIPKLNRPKDPNESKYMGSSSRAPQPRRDTYDSWSDSNSDLSSESDSDTRRRRHYRNYNEKSQPSRADKRKNEELSKMEHLGSSKKRRSIESGPPAAGRSQSPLSSPNKHIPLSDHHRESSHKKEPGFSMKFNRKVNMLPKSGVSDRLNGRRSDSEQDDNGSEAGSGPASPRNEGSVSPATRDLHAQHGDMNRLLAKEAEVSSTTTSNRRELLLKQLREIEAAIARKKNTTN